MAVIPRPAHQLLIADAAQHAVFPGMMRDAVPPWCGNHVAKLPVKGALANGGAAAALHDHVDHVGRVPVGAAGPPFFPAADLERECRHARRGIKQHGLAEVPGAVRGRMLESRHRIGPGKPHG